MKIRILLLSLCCFISACVSSGPDKANNSGAMINAGHSSKTLAILPFDNNSVADTKQYQALGHGLAAMLISDLSGRTSLNVIERGKISDLVKEIALGQSGVIDGGSAAKAGRLLGANNIAFGSFMVLGGQVRIDTRIVEVETGKVVMAEAVSGSYPSFLSLQETLAGKIANSLDSALVASSSKSSGSLAAALLFSRGVVAWDDGKPVEARDLFGQCLSLDKGYDGQINAVYEGK